MDFVTKSFGKVFNWSEFHLSQMTLLQNPYFSSNNMCTMILKGVFLEYWQQNFFFFCLEYDLSKVNFNSSFFCASRSPKLFSLKWYFLLWQNMKGQKLTFANLKKMPSEMEKVYLYWYPGNSNGKKKSKWIFLRF